MSAPDRLPPDVDGEGNEIPRPMRICDVCGQVDDHPRHIVAFPPDTLPVNQAQLAAVLDMDWLTSEERAKIVADIVDTSTQLRHMDCCTTVGCPDGTCDVHSNDLTGAALLAEILGGGQ